MLAEQHAADGAGDHHTALRPGGGGAKAGVGEGTEEEDVADHERAEAGHDEGGQHAPAEEAFARGLDGAAVDPQDGGPGQEGDGHLAQHGAQPGVDLDRRPAQQGVDGGVGEGGDDGPRLTGADQRPALAHAGGESMARALGPGHRARLGLNAGSRHEQCGRFLGTRDRAGEEGVEDR